MDLKREMVNFYRECQAYYEKLESVNLKDKVKEKRVQLWMNLLEDGDVYIDLGCGSGVFVNYAAILKNVYAIGVEISPIGCKLGKELSNKWKTKTDFIICDVEFLPFKDESVDKISSFEVLEHLVNPKSCLLEIARVCKDGALIILSMPHYFGGTFRPAAAIKFPLFLKMYLKFKRNETNSFLHTKPYLNREKWKRNPMMPDKDAVSWIYSETLLESFRRNGFTILIYDTWAYEKDILLKKSESTWCDRLKLAIIEFLSIAPIFKHFGPCICVVGKKVRL